MAIYENGAYRGSMGSYTTGDFLSIERKNGIIYYKKNNVILYTSTINNTASLYVDCSFATLGASVKNVNFLKPAEVIVAAYEYNELGQVVDKKLFSDNNGTSYKQSVDYRYTIKGQLESINNAQLIADTRNDETNDYFGMELLYHNTEAALNNTPYFDGNISAVKWKSAGSALAGQQDQRSYKYGYDKAGRLETSTSQVHNGAAWLKEVGVYNEAFSYDHNGNILSLQRNENQHGLVVSNGTPAVTSTPLQVDNLTYNYSSTIGDQLMRVEDAAANTKGFNNGNNGTDDYLYDPHGNVTKDNNKGISSITYNFLGKPSQILFTDGRKIVYTYDGSGNKLSVKNYEGTTLKFTTDYLPGAVYENGVLSFLSSPEGRMVRNGTRFEYQYAIADHQGNTRVLFTSEAPAPVAVTATFEGNASDNVDQFQNVIVNNVVPSVAANHTTGGVGVIQMNQGYKTGPAKSIKVFPGDVVDLEVWAYFEGSSGFGTTSSPLTTLITSVAGAFGGSSVPGDPGNVIYGGVEAAYGAFGAAGSLGDSRPTAYLNYIMFDQNYNVMDMGWKAVPATANFNKQRVYFDPLQIKEAGYIYTYLSYEGESSQYVYFDDFKITHTKTPVLQYSDYYAHGLQNGNSWTRENNKNNFLYNEGSEMNATSGFYDLPFRNYDAALGRFFQVDPLAHRDHSFSSYTYARNNPVMMNDPSGLMVPAPPQSSTWSEGQLRAYYYVHGGGGGSGSFQSWAADNGFDFGGPNGGSSATSNEPFWNSVLAAAANGYEGSVDLGNVNGGPVVFNQWCGCAVNAYEVVGQNPTNQNADYRAWAQQAVDVYESGKALDFQIQLNQMSLEAGHYDKGPNWLNVAGAQLNIWGIATTISVGGPKPTYTGPKAWATQKASGAKFGRLLGTAGLLLTAADMVSNGVNTSNSLDAFFGGVSFAGPWGAAAGGVYFAANLLTYGLTGETIGQHIDNNFYIIPAGGLPGTPFVIIPKN